MDGGSNWSSGIRMVLFLELWIKIIDDEYAFSMFETGARTKTTVYDHAARGYRRSLKKTRFVSVFTAVLDLNYLAPLEK